MPLSTKLITAFFSVVIAIVIGSGFLYSKMQPAASNIPTQVAQADSMVETNNVHSIDGKMNIEMTETVQSSGNTIYSVTTQNIKEGSEKTEIINTAYPEGTKLSVPVNAWSPNNKFIFLKKEKSGKLDFLVFHADGSILSSGEDFLNASEIFESKRPEFKLLDITGWASSTLLQVKAVDDNGNPVSFWIEIPSGVVIRLAH